MFRSGNGSWARAKRDFAKPARGFANWLASLPGFPLLWVAGGAAAVLMIVTGGFGTGVLPLGPLCLFWGLLFGWNTLKWQLWFALTVRAPRDWWRSAALGGLLINLPLPAEIAFGLSLAGAGRAPPAVAVWSQAAVIAAAIFAAIFLVVRWLSRRAAVEAAAPPAIPAANGLLDRARVDPAALVAVEAEDHYCRVRCRDGRSVLVHYRFGDALAELAGVPGAQVHRGAWAAADAVAGAVRRGRRWQLLLADGSSLPVSATHLASVRMRGWLRAPDAPYHAPKKSEVAFDAPSA